MGMESFIKFCYDNAELQTLENEKKDLLENIEKCDEAISFHESELLHVGPFSFSNREQIVTASDIETKYGIDPDEVMLMSYNEYKQTYGDSSTGQSEKNRKKYELHKSCIIDLNKLKANALTRLKVVNELIEERKRDIKGR